MSKRSTWPGYLSAKEQKAARGLARRCHPCTAGMASSGAMNSQIVGRHMSSSVPASRADSNWARCFLFLHTTSLPLLLSPTRPYLPAGSRSARRALNRQTE